MHFECRQGRNRGKGDRKRDERVGKKRKTVTQRNAHTHTDEDDYWRTEPPCL